MPRRKGIPIARRTRNTAIVEDAIALLLHRRRNAITAVIAMLIVAAASAIWSHSSIPPEARQIDGQPVTVARVIDGDTIVVKASILSKDEHVRLRGIDAPELAHMGNPVMHFGEEARRYLSSRLSGKTVTLKFDSPDVRDRYGRLLAFVYLNDGDCVNVDLVRDGMAYSDHRFKNYLQSEIDQVEAQARARQIGLWKNLTPDEMPPWRRKWLEKRGRGASY